jgi:hypothetical protein
MPKRKRSAVTRTNAARILEMLVEEGKILAHDIARYLKIAEVEDRLRMLRGGEVPVTHRRGKNHRNVKMKRSISVAGRKSYRIQGRYIAYIRRFPKAARSKYRKIAKNQGREKAIATMRKDLSRATTS